MPPDPHPDPLPAIPIPQDPFLPRRRLQALVNRLAGGQFLRYLGVGLFNTVFGYGTFAGILFLLTHIAPPHFLYLTVVAASLLSTPLNITVAYLGYKFLVFKTRGNYLVEWFKCFGVYGLGMLPGLLALSAVTRLLQTEIHAHGPALHTTLKLRRDTLHAAALTRRALLRQSRRRVPRRRSRPGLHHRLQLCRPQKGHL